MFGPDRFGHDPRYGYGYGHGFFDCCGPDLLSILAGVTLVVVHCLFIPGFSAPYWVSYDVNNTERHQGLWRICADMDATAETNFNCTDAIDESSLPDWFTATQSTMCISLIFLLLATGLIIYWLCSYSRYFFVKAIFICLLFLTFLLSLVGVILYGINAREDATGSNFSSDDFEFDWCFYLVDVSTVMFLFLPVLMMCIPSRESYPSLQPRDRFGFGYPRPPPPRPMGPGPMGPPRPRPRPPPYGGGRSPYPSLPPKLPYSNRY